MARILLADDDPAALEMIGRTLAADGHEVIRCADGHEAFQQLSAAPTQFDLLLTDIEMPGMDGLQLAGQATALAPQLRILLMSGFTDGPDQAADLGSAIAGFITKPLSLEQVRAAVRSALA